MATIGIKNFTIKLSKSFVSNATKELIHDADEEEKKEKHSHFHPHETVLLTVPKSLSSSKSTPALKNVLSEASLMDFDYPAKNNSTSTLSTNSVNKFENKNEKPIFHFDNEFDLSSVEHGTLLFR
uniref:Uncharacterized protein n=1 Tax=Panagrolaimus sp. ES5 TaxID=591445 RepID=A0AC34GY78_9BILA